MHCSEVCNSLDCVGGIGPWALDLWGEGAMRDCHWLAQARWLRKLQSSVLRPRGGRGGSQKSDSLGGFGTPPPFFCKNGPWGF